MPPSRKPKVARSAASRAKSGDVGAQVEVLIEWIGDVLAGKERMTFLQMLTTIGVLIAAGAACVGAYLLLGSKVVAIKPSDSAQLKKVFYTGEPWLIECTSSSSASPMVYGAESALKGVQIGTLDCGAMLPSGKTTFERFKLKEPNYGPVLLAAANGERPQIAPRNVLTDTALVSWVKTATKAKMFAPTNGAQFESQCLRKPWCVPRTCERCAPQPSRSNDMVPVHTCLHTAHPLVMTPTSRPPTPRPPPALVLLVLGASWCSPPLAA